MLVVAAKTKGLFEEEVDDLMAVARAVGLTTHGSASTGANSDSLRRKFQILDSLRRKSPETNENVSAHTDVQFCNSCNSWVKKERRLSRAAPPQIRTITIKNHKSIEE